MNALEKLNIAKLLLEEYLENLIISISVNYDFKRIHVLLKDGVNIYIVYNNHEEYSYSVIFSKLELDRCRFDNYDKVWDVPSRPHHFHPRFKNEAVQSSMTGDPNQDIPLM
ncbi:MAG: hypothetical protein JW891_18530 [Candidatus Lokiarchaeota archaeon]|nr:hypothetical protein [Candidatus Lokiarchaeota archaeon]